MIVVSDTSPLNYLILIGEIDVLPRLFGEIYAPPAVLREALDPGSPHAVRAWAGSPPAWLKVKEPLSIAPPPARLGSGEVEAIALAGELGADLLLMDDRQGIRHARCLGLRAIGTLAVIEGAAARGLLALPEALARLQATSFRASAQLLRTLLERDAARRSHPGE